MKNLFLICLLLAVSFPALANEWDSEGLEDGTYDATVTTDSGSYTVPVEVHDGEVSHVQWTNGAI
jgi:uncharacterized protein with FMN-binding domain